MSKVLVCNICGQVLPAKQSAELTAEGWPLRGSTGGQMGLPIVKPPTPFHVALDGQKVDRCVAYSLPEGFVLLRSDLRTKDGFASVRADGVVTLHAIEPKP